MGGGKGAAAPVKPISMNGNDAPKEEKFVEYSRKNLEIILEKC
jgi:hypothetical protein